MWHIISILRKGGGWTNNNFGLLIKVWKAKELPSEVKCHCQSQEESFFSFKRPRHLSHVTVFMKINTIFPARFPSEALVDGVWNPERRDREQPSGMKTLLEKTQENPVFSWLESERWKTSYPASRKSQSQRFSRSGLRFRSRPKTLSNAR